jgi:uncharacterized membrane protein HdeD (DUF308 family)
MFRLSSTSLLLQGLLGIAIGLIAIAWPGVTVGAVVFIFAVLVFTDSLMQLVRAFDTDGGSQSSGEWHALARRTRRIGVAAVIAKPSEIPAGRGLERQPTLIRSTRRFGGRKCFAPS